MNSECKGEGDSSRSSMITAAGHRSCISSSPGSVSVMHAQHWGQRTAAEISGAHLPSGSVRYATGSLPTLYRICRSTSPLLQARAGQG